MLETEETTTDGIQFLYEWAYQDYVDSTFTEEPHQQSLSIFEPVSPVLVTLSEG